MREILKSPIVIALSVTLLCWMLVLTDAMEVAYWNGRYKLPGASTPSTSIIISLDSSDKSRERHAISSTMKQAQLLAAIRNQRPRHIFFDVPSVQGVDAAGDAELVRAVAAAGNEVTLVVRANYDLAAETGTLTAPRLPFPASTRVAVSQYYLSFNDYAKRAPVSAEVEGRLYPTIPAVETRSAFSGQSIVPDFSVDPASVTIIDADLVLAGGLQRDVLRGRDVFVAATDPNLSTTVGYFGKGRQPSAMADIASVASARQGPAIAVGQLPWLMFLLLMIYAGNRTPRLMAKITIYATLIVTLLVMPAILLKWRIFSGSELGLVAAAVYAPNRMWQRWRRKAELTNSASGLPNIEALAAKGISPGYDVIVAAIGQYEQMLASLPRERHGECARQIARRLAIASGDSEIHVTDTGYFVWLEPPRPIEGQIEHLEGLKALFAMPLVIDGQLLDTNIHFGLDRISEGAPMQRIQAALACAGEAEAKGKLYEEFEQQRMANVPWELSLHARIDNGLRNGDIWLALQPQFDFRTQRICGAEALIRWSDPERGMIPPDAFILQAERAGRIEAITYWVLERAIEYSKQLNERWHPFQVSINLSARMADDTDLIDHVAEIVARHDFDCALMTMEVTETFSMTNSDIARRNLAMLRQMGFRLSIDDFGTGLASLAYLAEIPSDEIKIDKCFVQAIVTESREKLIVRSVIDLAHALGQEIVAEGVEDLATLRALAAMGCDIAQGYYICRPSRIEQLEAVLEQSWPNLQETG